MKVYSNALEIISDYYGSVGSGRHQIADEVISIYSSSEEAFDILGVAYAYMWSGAKFRKEAILYFEKYLSHSYKVNIPYQGITLWGIYSNLASLYEKEHKFEQAILCLKKCISINNGNNPADYTRIGDILVKLDTNKAEEFYIQILNDPKLQKHKRVFAYSLDEVREKKARGYIYKKRKDRDTK